MVVEEMQKTFTKIKEERIGKVCDDVKEEAEKLLVDIKGVAVIGELFDKIKQLYVNDKEGVEKVFDELMLG